jgi:ADP-ribose pyrophosphatase
VTAGPDWLPEPAWPVHGRTTEWSNPFFDAGTDTVERPDGALADYYWIEPADVATTVAVDDGAVVFVEQYRPRPRDRTLELPTGGVDTGETPAEAAIRELREETGYRADSVTHVETYLPSGWVRARRHVFVAEGLTAGAPDLDDGEHIETRRVPLDDAIETVRSDDSLTTEWAVTPLLLAREDGLL